MSKKEDKECIVCEMLHLLKFFDIWRMFFKNRVIKIKNFLKFFNKGKFIKKMMIAIQNETDIQAYPTVIKNGKLYQLVENIEKQECSLSD